MRVTLAEPDPRWPEIFAAERDRIRAALGDRALAIEHVGSTAVPGLPAKPIVDVLVVADVDCSALLEGIGLEGHERALWKRAEPCVYVHVRGSRSPDVTRLLAFRDRLRADAGDRALYLAAKRSLAEREWTRAREYAEAKDAVIADILSRA